MITNPTITVCAFFKDEAAGMREWLLHYVARGVTRFILIDDQSSDASVEIARATLPPEYLTILSTVGLSETPNRQNRIYNELILPTADGSWWLFVDLDEFVWDSTGVNLVDYVASLPADVTFVPVPIYDFGDNGHVAQPASIVQSFTTRAVRSSAARPDSSKPLVLSSAVQRIDFHNPTMSAGRSLSDATRLRVNHYKLQSRSRWDNLVVPRGSANRTPLGALRHASGFFDKFQQSMNAVTDTGLVDQNAEIS